MRSRRSREKSRTAASCLWSWQRTPSYLSSTQSGVPRRRTASAASTAAWASMGSTGVKYVKRVGSRRPRRASSGDRAQVGPMAVRGADGLDRLTGGVGDGVLERLLLHADPRLAQHRLDERPDRAVRPSAGRPPRGAPPWPGDPGRRGAPRSSPPRRQAGRGGRGRSAWRWSRARRPCRPRRRAGARRPRPPRRSAPAAPPGGRLPASRRPPRACARRPAGRGARRDR